jgi:hypothetical protein
MRIHTSFLSLFAAAALAVAALAVPASAQADLRYEVHVPFAFKAGTVDLPAGDYSVRRQATGVLILQNDETDETAVLAPAPLDTHAKSIRVKLVFLRGDAGAVLSEVRWFDGTMTYRSAPGRDGDAVALSGKR